jgi:hypothetical protein
VTTDIKIFSYIVPLIVFFTLPVLARDVTRELQKTEALLEVVKSSDVIFIRNGTEYTAKEAYEHLKKKLKAAQKSWFAPPREKWTAQLFIEKVASRSSLTRKPYLIRSKDGKVIEARVWLLEKLRVIEASFTISSLR